MKIKHLLEHRESTLNLLKLIKMAQRNNPGDLPPPFLQNLIISDTTGLKYHFRFQFPKNYNGLEIPAILLIADSDYDAQISCNIQQVKNADALKSLPKLFFEFFGVDYDQFVKFYANAEKLLFRRSIESAVNLGEFPLFDVQVHSTTIDLPENTKKWLKFITFNNIDEIKIIMKAAKQHPANDTWPYKINN